MTQHDPDRTAVIDVIERYIKGYINADETLLRQVFAPDAVMNGYVGDRLVEGTPEPFIARVSSEPALASQGLDLHYEIIDVQVMGNAATVSLKEYDFGPFSFMDFMHVLKRDGTWKIVSKTFSTF